MKKRLLALVFACTLVLTGCMGEEEMEKETREFAASNDDGKKDENTRTYDDIVEYVDFSKSHIYVEMMDRFTVDADITTDAPDEMGIYEYEYYLDGESLSEEGKELDKFVKLVDDYYGKDVSMTYEEVDEKALAEGLSDEEVDYSSVTISYNGNDAGYNVLKDVEVFFSAYDISFPYYGSDYDETMIEGVIEEFTNHFKNFMPKDIGDDYRCIHFNDDYWLKAGEVFGEYYKEDGLYNDLDFYFVRMYAEVENGIYSEDEIQINYDSLGEESVPDGFAKSMETVSSYGCRSSYVDILIDENGEVFAFDFSDCLRIGQCTEVKEIIDVKEALGLVYELYAPYPLYKQITVREMKLKYIPVLSNEVDENGYRGAELEPVWSVKYTKDDEFRHSTIILSAITGEILEKEN